LNLALNILQGVIKRYFQNVDESIFICLKKSFLAHLSPDSKDHMSDKLTESIFCRNKDADLIAYMLNAQHVCVCVCEREKEELHIASD
jgi:hypothetical protein